MTNKPEPADDSIYTLRRRIPARPSDGQEELSNQGARIPEPGQQGHSVSPATRLNSLISRLLPSVRLG